jgi:hypothetical protein
MTATLVKHEGHQVIVQLTVNLTGQMLNDEQALQDSLNAAGQIATEAACKTLVKQRMCLSGSRWRDAGASCVLALRALKLTKDRWQQFWGYVMRHECTAC